MPALIAGDAVILKHASQTLLVRERLAEALNAGRRARGRLPERRPRHAGTERLIAACSFPQDDGGAYLMPQVLVDVDLSMRVMKEESFGPVFGIMPVQNDRVPSPS